MDNKPNILVIYTGGTIGMVQDIETGRYKPFKFEHLLNLIPELKSFDFNISTFAFENPIDSSDTNPDVWITIAETIEHNYQKYDGFVILHGSDTMAHTASALSFMIENLEKPIVFTGSQLPIGVIRTDGKENLISAIEVAAARRKDGTPCLTEVAIYFEYLLLRANRTHKYSAEYFDAFRSDNYPTLAVAGVKIEYDFNAIESFSMGEKLIIRKDMNRDIAILKMFPGITKKVVEAILNIKDLKAIVLETYGSGNTTTEDWFVDSLQTAINKGIIIFNVTQCSGGHVDQGLYETSRKLREAGVIGGSDITTESAVTKLMYLLGQQLPLEKTKELLITSLRGEMQGLI
jgi:L-asparaginase